MAGKELTFKLVMDADTKGFDSGTKASKDKWEAFISVLKKESEDIRTSSAETSKAIGDIVPDKLNKNTKEAKDSLAGLSNAAENAGENAKRAGFEISEAIPGDAVQLAEMLGNKFFIAAKEIEALGDKSTISAGELRAMSSAGEQGLNELNLVLKAAQAELVRLQSTDGTLQDIEIAKGRVLSIQDAIRETSSAFNYYQGVAVNAMKGVDNATQVAINKIQQFSSVDLTGVVGEAQTASRAIERMGNGASISAKEIERVGQLGASSINTLERELQQATNELKALSQSTDAVPLGKFTEASNKAGALEDALSLTKNAYTDFQAKASTAMGRVSSSTDATGKAVVKSMDEWAKSNDRVRNSAERIGDGYRHAGQIAREEAKSSTEAWSDAVAAASKQFDAEMKRQSKSLSNGIYNYNSYSKADVLSQLKSKGYSDKEAEKLAGSIWSEAMAADRSAKEQGLGKDGNLGIKALINQEFDAAAAKGLTTQHGTNKINDLLRQMTASNLVSTGPSTKPVDVNSLAPNVSAPVPSTPTVNASKSVNYNISFGGQTLSLSGSAEQESMMNQLINQLKTQAKST